MAAPVQHKLERALRHLSLMAVREALVAGADPNAPDAEGRAPLMAIWHAPRSRFHPVAPPTRQGHVLENMVTAALFDAGAQGDVRWHDPHDGVTYNGFLGAVHRELTLAGLPHVNLSVPDSLDRLNLWLERGAQVDTTSGDAEVQVTPVDLLDERARLALRDLATRNTLLLRQFSLGLVELLVAHGLSQHRLRGKRVQHLEQFLGKAALATAKAMGKRRHKQDRHAREIPGLLCGASNRSDPLSHKAILNLDLKSLIPNLHSPGLVRVDGEVRPRKVAQVSREQLAARLPFLVG